MIECKEYSSHFLTEVEQYDELSIICKLQGPYQEQQEVTIIDYSKVSTF